MCLVVYNQKHETHYMLFHNCTTIYTLHIFFYNATKRPTCTSFYLLHDEKDILYAVYSTKRQRSKSNSSADAGYSHKLDHHMLVALVPILADEANFPCENWNPVKPAHDFASKHNSLQAQTHTATFLAKEPPGGSLDRQPDVARTRAPADTPVIAAILDIRHSKDEPVLASTRGDGVSETATDVVFNSNTELGDLITSTDVVFNPIIGTAVDSIKDNP